MKMIQVILCLFLSTCLVPGSKAQQQLWAGAKLVFKATKTTMTQAEKLHVFQQLDIKWATNKSQFVDKDDVDETAPYLQVNFFPVDMNGDGKEEVFIVLVNPALYEKTGAQIILFTKDADGSYQKNTEIPSEDIMPLSRKHLGYPDILLSSSELKFTIWRWNGTVYRFFQKVTGQQLPDGPNSGLEQISKAYQAHLKNKAGKR